jgi:pre-mRNA-splicing factor ISY1
VQEAEAWRKSIVRELIKKVSDIQNASLGEHRIRDLNDEINALLKEKTRWELHIRSLGGPDYKSAALALTGTSQFDNDALEVPGADGYKYFGAAKNLPKVRELFQKEMPQAPKESRQEMYKRVTYSYLGYGCATQDGMLEAAERKYEQKVRQEAVEAASNKRRKIEESEKMINQNVTNANNNNINSKPA